MNLSHIYRQISLQTIRSSSGLSCYRMRLFWNRKVCWRLTGKVYSWELYIICLLQLRYLSSFDGVKTRSVSQTRQIYSSTPLYASSNSINLHFLTLRTWKKLIDEIYESCCIFCQEVILLLRFCIGNFLWNQFRHCFESTEPLLNQLWLKISFAYVQNLSCWILFPKDCFFIILILAFSGSTVQLVDFYWANRCSVGLWLAKIDVNSCPLSLHRLFLWEISSLISCLHSC